MGQNFTDKTDNGQAKIFYNADVFTSLEFEQFRITIVYIIIL